MSEIKHVHVGSRMSKAVIHNGVAYLAGQVPTDASADVEGQTRQVLQTIDRLLKDVGSDKSRLLSAQVFLANIAEFEGINRAWDDWVADVQPPARATVEARLANADYKVEIMVTAAVK